MSEIGTTNQRIKIHILIHFNIALPINSNHTFSTILHIKSPSLPQKSTSNLISPYPLVKLLKPLSLLNPLHNLAEYRIVMTQYIWWVVGIVDICAQHVNTDFVVFDQLLNIPQLCYISDMPLRNLICIHIKVMFIQQGTCLQHFLKRLVPLLTPLMFYGQLPHEHLAGLHKIKI